MPFITEADVEALALGHFAELGYAVSSDGIIGPDGSAPEREAYADILLIGRLYAAIEKLNPNIFRSRRATTRCVRSWRRNCRRWSRKTGRLHRLMVEGVGVEFRGDDGAIRGDTVRLIDFDIPVANDWLAVSQFTVIAGTVHRRPDVVVFVNGLPLGVIELKNPGGENADAEWSVQSAAKL